MLFQPRLSSKTLAGLSHRLGLEMESGIDVRRTWKREADNAPPRYRAAFAQVRDAVARGDTLSEALARTGALFPKLFLELVDVGEQTGTLARVFPRLARHYDRQQKMQRAWLVGISWPLIQLAAALAVIGILILALGVVAQRNHGEPIDILGLGLIGFKGFVIYVNFLVAVGLCVAGLVLAIRRGMLWTRPIQRMLIRLPGFGLCLQKLALANLTWALHLTMNVAMDLREVVPLVLRATGNDHYIRHTDAATAAVAAGEPLHVALGRTGAFPNEFIEALEVAEESGQTVESMQRLSRQYEEQAEAALRTLTILGGFAVWGLVMALIVLAIFRLAAFYIGTINDALNF